MAKIGYARVSSKDQKLDRQLEALQDVSKLFSDKLSGQSTKRPQLQAMLDYIREGDIVIVTELDRLGRNNKDLTNIMNQIQQKGATLEVLNLPSMNGIEDENLRRLINNLVIEQISTLNRIYTPETFARITRNVEAPTLILWGKQDKIFNVEVADELKSLLKRAEAPVILNNVGHMPLLEADKQVANYYLPFLAKTQNLKNPLADQLIPLH